MSRHFSLLCLAAILFILFGLVGDQPPMRAACDTDCRTKFDFYLCHANPGVDNCLSYSMDTCEWCVRGGGCDNKVAGGGTCTSTSTVPAYYWTGCTYACPCPVNTTYVEADKGGSSNNPVALRRWVCN
jgi:hypothetical protein